MLTFQKFHFVQQAPYDCGPACCWMILFFCSHLLTYRKWANRLFMNDDYDYNDFLQSIGTNIENGIWTIELVKVLKDYSFRFVHGINSWRVGAYSAQPTQIRLPRSTILSLSIEWSCRWWVNSRTMTWELNSCGWITFSIQWVATTFTFSMYLHSFPFRHRERWRSTQYATFCCSTPMALFCCLRTMPCCIHHGAAA